MKPKPSFNEDVDFRRVLVRQALAEKGLPSDMEQHLVAGSAIAYRAGSGIITLYHSARLCKFGCDIGNIGRRRAFAESAQCRNITDITGLREC